MESPSPLIPCPSPRPSPHGERGKKAAAGYNLVMLMVLLAVLNIVIAASLPAWSGVIRREKEEELVFRGLQYAEAIRVFQNRFQRPPIRLEELIEVEPRSIRKLWKDPMTEDGKWALIPLQGPPGGPPEQGLGGKGGNKEGGDDEQEDGEVVQIGPLKGVHSKSKKTSFLIFNGKDHYDEWWFTVDLLVSLPGPGGNPDNPVGGGMTMSARWIGRPLPEFLQFPQGTGLPDGRGGIPGGGSPPAKGGQRPRGDSGKQPT